MNHNLKEIQLPKDTCLEDRLLKIEGWANQDENSFRSNLELYRLILLRKKNAIKYLKSDNPHEMNIIFIEIRFINDLIIKLLIL